MILFATLKLDNNLVYNLCISLSSQQLAGVHTSTVPNADDGSLDLEDIKNNIRDKTDDHFPLTKVSNKFFCRPSHCVMLR